MKSVRTRGSGDADFPCEIIAEAADNYDDVNNQEVDAFASNVRDEIAASL